MIGTVDSASFGHTQLRPVDQRGHVGWVGVPVADESLGAGRLVNGRFEDPTAALGVTQLGDSVDVNATAAVVSG